VTPTLTARRAAASEARHLGRDGLPPYPPPRPWPEAPGHTREGPLWVFAYGSLIWHPGFPFVESRVGRVHGHHRALCVWSWEYRGTVRYPGLVLGLDRGGSCTGVVFRVAEADREATVAYLMRREVPAAVYRPVRKPVRLEDGRDVAALTFQVDRQQERYAGPLAEGEVLGIVSSARGRRGANADYVFNTADHLERLGIPCARLRRLTRALRAA
jgi:cation transport protein ChaC